MNTPMIYRINKRHVFDPSKNTLLHSDGTVQTVEPLLSKLIVYLIEHAPSTVAHGMLIDLFWGPTVKGEEALVKAVSKIRRLLGPEVIRTVSKKGYAWTGSVEAEGPRDRFNFIREMPKFLRRKGAAFLFFFVLLLIVKAIFFPHVH